MTLPSLNIPLKDPRRRGRFLDLVERIGNQLPDPVTIFLVLAIFALVASWLAAKLGVSVPHPNPARGRIHAVNLLNRDGVRRILENIVDNFTGFRPLGTVLVAMIGVGVAERTGLFAAMLKALVLSVPGWAITPAVIFAGMMSNAAADAGFVILPPLAAMLYASIGRHPLAGIAAAFAGVGGGFSANLILSALDPLLSGITEQAGRFYDPAYAVPPTANWFFMAASVPILTAVGTFVSNRIIEPRLGPWTPAADADNAVRTMESKPRLAASPIHAPAADAAPESLTPLDAVERRGLWAALLAALATLAVMYVLARPGAPLRDPATGGFEPLFRSVVGLILLFFVVPGLVFGLVTRRVRSDRDASNMMSHAISAMGTYIVLAFFAAQAIAYFDWSQLGLIFALKSAEVLKALDFTGLPLLIALIGLTALFNLVIASASAKWAIMAPIFVPMLMALGWSPETAQGVYRVGDSFTNIITPLNYYLPIIILAAQRYDRRAGMGTILSTTMPYAIAFGLTWTLMLTAWISLGWPLGPGSPLHYVAP